MRLPCFCLPIASVCYTFVLFFATTADADSLRIVHVSSPAVNCVFNSDCLLSVTDLARSFAVPAASGEGMLQSRTTTTAGAAGTPGAGLYPYEYRINLTAVGALTARICVKSLALDFGPIEPLDYNGDGRSEDVYVVTRGGLGSVAPSSAEQTGRVVTFSFSPAVCPGNRPGAGENSFFFGLASSHPPDSVQAKLVFTDGSDVTTEARAPEGPLSDGGDGTTPVDCAVFPVGPSGADTVPIDPTTPACRCFQDLALRLETHCGFFSPDLAMFWRIPIPLPPGDPFRITRATWPFSKAGVAAEISLIAPSGFEQLSRGTDLKEPTTRSLTGVWLKAIEKPGSYESHFEIRLPTGPNGSKIYEVAFPIKIHSPRQ